MRAIVILVLGALAGLVFGSAVSLAQTAVADSAEKTAVQKPGTETESDAESDDPSYLRIERDADGKKRALQTAIVRYTGQPGTRYDGAIVDLVGVVHIGETDYYEDLNNRLSKYDTVLYELVAPDGTRIRPEDLKNRRSIIASMQTGMKDMLGLEYQLELIDYLATNFRHADMSPEEFSKDLERRGDSVWKMVARMMGAGLATQSKTGGDVGVLMALFSDDRPTAMKNAMATQLVDMEAVTAGINDANGENTLIKGRNAKAFEVLKEELAAGKEKLAVFYGAGHLSDMAQRLENEFGMQPGKTTWLDAWDLNGQP
ncbi:TraB/GumN family protein [Roseiconus nitratireducens]|uniref:TraB/GumN family protein n=1 Tax=Roseiconus nitratireducens TaxID=2605748 RepID=UPI001F25F460|nr:TraB/GumN family protein [Roseiconus nitratireducens]